MQKMQSAAGGKGRGAGGMPTPAQIQAMQVNNNDHIIDGKLLSRTPLSACNAPWHASTDAETATRGWWHARNDEGHDARPRRRPVRYGGNAA